VIRGGAKSGEAMRGSARRAPGWPWGRGSAAVELRGLAGGRLPRWRSAWSKGNGYGGARPWAAALRGACGGGGPMQRLPSPCLGGSCGGSAVGGPVSVAVGIHSWFFFQPRAILSFCCTINTVQC
jgi:hypothetical protein